MLAGAALGVVSAESNRAWRGRSGNPLAAIAEPFSFVLLLSPPFARLGRGLGGCCVFVCLGSGVPSLAPVARPRAAPLRLPRPALRANRCPSRPSRRFVMPPSAARRPFYSITRHKKKVVALSALGGSVKLRRLCLKARRCRAESPACKKGASVAALAPSAPFLKRVGAAPSVAHLFSGRRFRSELRGRKRQKGGVSVFVPVFARLTVRAALKPPVRFGGFRRRLCPLVRRRICLFARFCAAHGASRTKNSRSKSQPRLL